MKILKEKYATIPDSAFLLKNSDSLFSYYTGEFLKTESNVKGFSTMFLNIIKDFLEKKIDEKALSSIIYISLFDEKTKKYHFEPYLWEINDLLALIHELLDVTWTKESENYSEYLKTVQTRLTQLVQIVQNHQKN